MTPIIGDLIQGGFNLFKSYFPPDLNPAQKAKLEEGVAKIQNELTTKVIEYSENELTQRASIIKAEAQGESWLQRNWRPITMLTFVAIIANNYILFPYIKLFGGSATMLQLPPFMWDLLKLGMGGYIVGRSVEKGFKIHKGWTNVEKSK